MSITFYIWLHQQICRRLQHIRHIYWIYRSTRKSIVYHLILLENLGPISFKICSPLTSLTVYISRSTSESCVLMKSRCSSERLATAWGTSKRSLTSESVKDILLRRSLGIFQPANIVAKTWSALLLSFHGRPIEAIFFITCHTTLSSSCACFVFSWEHDRLPVVELAFVLSWGFFYIFSFFIDNKMFNFFVAVFLDSEQSAEN